MTIHLKVRDYIHEVTKSLQMISLLKKRKIENTNGAGEGEDLYLSVGTRRRTTTGDDELGAGSKQSYQTAQPEEETGRRGEERRKQKGEMGRKSPR